MPYILDLLKRTVAGQPVADMGDMSGLFVKSVGLNTGGDKLKIVFQNSSNAEESVEVTLPIGNAAVTQAMLQDAAVNAAKLAAGAVETVKLANLAVTKAKLAANAVDQSKVDPAAQLFRPQLIGSIDVAAPNQGSWQATTTTFVAPAAGSWMLVGIKPTSAFGESSRFYPNTGGGYSYHVIPAPDAGGNGPCSITFGSYGIVGGSQPTQQVGYLNQCIEVVKNTTTGLLTINNHHKFSIERVYPSDIRPVNVILYKI